MDIQEQSELRDEANTILLPQKDDDGRRISEGQPKGQSLLTLMQLHPTRASMF